VCLQEKKQKQEVERERRKQEKEVKKQKKFEEHKRETLRCDLTEETSSRGIEIMEEPFFETGEENRKNNSLVVRLLLRGYSPGDLKRMFEGEPHS
jgi:hypothetical protein